MRIQEATGLVDTAIRRSRGQRKLCAAPSPLHLTMAVTLKHYPRLLCTWQRGAVAKVKNRHRRPLASVDQPLQHLRRQIGQPQLAAHMTLCEVHGDGKVTNRAKLAGFHAPPPTPGPTDRAQDMGVLCLILAGVGTAFRPLGLIQTGST